jgi:hypothetical protein
MALPTDGGHEAVETFPTFGAFDQASSVSGGSAWGRLAHPAMSRLASIKMAMSLFWA